MMRYTAELPDTEDPEIGEELIQVHYADGRTEELRLHDYARIYGIPGLYERVVHDRLGCRSPAQFAAMLGRAVDALHWDRRDMRVLDIAAGNGISGQALRREHLRPVLGTDIVPEAREAALRDRPGTYEHYEILDLLNLTDEQAASARELNLNALSCVAPVGTTYGQLPPEALTHAAWLLTKDALVIYMHDPQVEPEDPIIQQAWGTKNISAQLLERTRYVHRYTVTGRPYEMDAVVWRLNRPD
jgi:hypothetical protein